METELLDLECPVCSDYLQAPIRLCSEGHSICDVCKNKLFSCPTCTKDFLELRNYTLESLLERASFPCKYEQFGCTQRLKIAERTIHESAGCDFKPFPCIFCGDNMQLLHLEDHFLECSKEKEFNIVFKSEDLGNNDGSNVIKSMLTFNIEGESKEVVLIKVDSWGLFIQHYIKKGSVWYFWVSLAKSINKTEKYICEMVLMSHTDVVLSCTVPVYSLHTDVTKMIEEGCCLTITDNMIKMMSEETGKVCINLLITLKENLNPSRKINSTLQQLCQQNEPLMFFPQTSVHLQSSVDGSSKTFHNSKEENACSSSHMSIWEGKNEQQNQLVNKSPRSHFIRPLEEILRQNRRHYEKCGQKSNVDGLSRSKTHKKPYNR